MSSRGPDDLHGKVTHYTWLLGVESRMVAAREPDWAAIGAEA